MRHIIAHLVRGEANGYLTALSKDLVNTFDTFPIHNRIPFHFTLKRWFELSKDDIQKLHSLLDGFAQAHTQSDYAMNKFGSFREDTLFLDVAPSEKMQSDVLELMDVLHTHPRLTFDEYDNGGDFHATLAMSALKPFDFDVIKNYLDTIEQPAFNLKFDNIAILKNQILCG